LLQEAATGGAAHAQTGPYGIGGPGGAVTVARPPLARITRVKPLRRFETSSVDGERRRRRTPEGRTTLRCVRGATVVARCSTDDILARSARTSGSAPEVWRILRCVRLHTERLFGCAEPGRYPSTTTGRSVPMMRERAAWVVAQGWKRPAVGSVGRCPGSGLPPNVSRETPAREGLPSMVDIRLWWMTARTTPGQRRDCEDTTGRRP
jgi:hypothetical protein